MSALKTITFDPSTAIIPQPVWPLPRLNDQAPVLLVHEPSDPAVELAYEHPHDPDGPLVRSTKSRSTGGFFLPPRTPVFSVFDGRIMYAGKHADGHVLIVEHANGWMTYYRHLEHMFALSTDRYRSPQRVRAGDILGWAGHARAAPLRAIRFELWKLDEHCGYVAIDPIRFMRRWRLMPWHESASERGTPPQTTRAA